MLSLAQLQVVNNVDPSGTLAAMLNGTNGPVANQSYLKATLPSAASNIGGTIYVSDATGAHVTGSLAFSNGTSWIDVTTGIAVA